MIPTFGICSNGTGTSFCIEALVDYECRVVWDVGRVGCQSPKCILQITYRNRAVILIATWQRRGDIIFVRE